MSEEGGEGHNNDEQQQQEQQQQVQQHSKRLWPRARDVLRVLKNPLGQENTRRGNHTL